MAVVAAATAAAAKDGAEAVAVRYAQRPVVVDGVAALAEGAPRLHDGVARNRVYDWECGDPEATARAIASAAHVTRLTVVDNRLVTCFLEPRAALAEWDAVAGRYTLHASLQSVHALAANLARILGVPTERVRCITGDVGGGFGSKIQPYPEYVALAWAAHRIGRPLKWVSSRSEGFVSDAQSRDHVLDGELALDARGRITALRVRSTSNVGAYVAPSIPISTLTNMERMISGLYAIPAIHLRVEGVLTNTVPINVYRGVGRLECVYTVERLIERTARATGRDRAELRRANMMRTFPYRSATGAVYDSGDYVARLDEAIALADTDGFAARRAEAAARATSKRPIDRSVPTTRNAPSPYSMSGAAASSRCAAILVPVAMRASDASTAALPPRTIEREAKVPTPFATRSVSPMTMLTVSKGTPSRSATTWAKTVSWPWPCDWLPIGTSTIPVGSTRTSAYSWGRPPVPSV